MTLGRVTIPRHFRRTPVAATALLVALSATACDVPNFEGPQVQNPPVGFLNQPQSYQQYRMFNDHEIVHHDAWIEASSGPYSGIYINGYAGALGEDSVYAAYDRAMALLADSVTFGPVERMTIDERPAWGWAEHLRTPERGLDWVQYRVAVSYDSITYALEFYGGDPAIKAKPDSLKVILASFAIGKTTYNLPLIAVLVGATLLLLNVMRGRAQARARRHQSISLKQIPKEELEKLKAAREGSGGSAAGGGAGASGSGGGTPGGGGGPAGAGSGGGAPAAKEPPGSGSVQ